MNNLWKDLLVTELGAPSASEWQVALLALEQEADAATLEQLFALGRIQSVHDMLEAQIRDLIVTRAPGCTLTEEEISNQRDRLLEGRPPERYGRWAYYPWSGRLVHLLPPREFRQLRLDRNRNKITSEEQERLARLTVGIVGLSVGNAIALTLALEGACGHLKLADFDRLDLSNMNRLRAGVHELGLPKTVLAARQILEMDPYTQITLFSEGITEANIEAFFTSDPPLDILIEECDSLDKKVRLRERARELHLPVLMETSDRGMLDIERFDLEPDRPLFHGRAEGLASSCLQGLTTEEKVPILLNVLGAENLSARMGASLMELNYTLKTWPQLGSDVTLGGATVAAAVRRIGLGLPLDSGRRYIDLQGLLDTPEAPPLASPPVLPPTSTRVDSSSRSGALSEFIRFVLEQGILAPSAANLQPWQFYVEDNTIWALHRQTGASELLDVGYYASYMALGAAVENIAIAAAARGRRTRVLPFPVSTDPTVVAKIDFEPAIGPQEQALSALFPLIAQRMTNRCLSERKPLPVACRRTLEAAACEMGGALQLITEADALEEIGRILGAGDRIRFLNPHLHQEAMSEIRWTPEEAQSSGDGIDSTSMATSAKEMAAMHLTRRADVAALLRDTQRGQGLEEWAQDRIASASAVGMLTLEGNSPVDHFHSGRVLQRVWLTATAYQLAFHPMTALLSMFLLLQTEADAIYNEHERATLQALQSRLDRLFAPVPGRSRVMLFRLAQAPQAEVRSARLPLECVLTTVPPAALHPAKVFAAENSPKS